LDGAGRRYPNETTIAPYDDDGLCGQRSSSKGGRKCRKIFHGSEAVEGGLLVGLTDTDYFYFQCPGNSQILQLLDFNVLEDGPVAYAPEFRKKLGATSRSVLSCIVGTADFTTS